MRRLFVVAAVLISAVAGGAQDTGSLPRILSFEVDHPGGVPGGWNVNPPGSAQADEKIVRCQLFPTVQAATDFATASASAA